MTSSALVPPARPSPTPFNNLALFAALSSLDLPELVMVPFAVPPPITSTSELSPTSWSESLARSMGIREEEEVPFVLVYGFDRRVPAKGIVGTGADCGVSRGMARGREDVDD